jgi:hypothetical protein
MYYKLNNKSILLFTLIYSIISLKVPNIILNIADTMIVPSLFYIINIIMIL